MATSGADAVIAARGVEMNGGVVAQYSEVRFNIFPASDLRHFIPEILNLPADHCA